MTNILFKILFLPFRIVWFILKIPFNLFKSRESRQHDKMKGKIDRNIRELKNEAKKDPDNAKKYRNQIKELEKTKSVSKKDFKMMEHYRKDPKDIRKFKKFSRSHKRLLRKMD